MTNDDHDEIFNVYFESLSLFAKYYYYQRKELNT